MLLLLHSLGNEIKSIIICQYYAKLLIGSIGGTKLPANIRKSVASSPQ